MKVQVTQFMFLRERNEKPRVAVRFPERFPPAEVLQGLKIFQDLVAMDSRKVTFVAHREPTSLAVLYVDEGRWRWIDDDAFESGCYRGIPVTWQEIEL